MEAVDKGIIIKKSTLILKNEKVFSEEYEISKKLGQGSYGTVFNCIHKETGSERAAKEILKSRIKNINQFRTEIKILQALDHPNVIKLFEYFEEEDKIYMIMEKCTGGELFDRILAKEYFSEKEGARIFKQILLAINYCHNSGVCHRDLKPENFIFETESDDSDIKIIDFGLSKIFDPRKPGDAEMKTGCGTPYYISPEVLTHNYNEACDLWSAGCILYVLLCGYPPFYGDDDKEIIENVRIGDFDYPAEEWEDVSEEAKDLIQKLITHPEKRLTAYEALKHSWIKSLAKNSKKEKLTKIDIKSLQGFQRNEKMKKAAITFIATQISTDQIQHLKKKFEAIDKNGDGNITIKELRDNLKDVRNKEEIIQMMIGADTDNSGTINYTEFLAATMEQNLYLKEENLRNAFRMFDKDGSGKISVEEVKSILGAQKYQSEIPEAQWEQLIGEVDQNGDGELDFEEFLKMMKASMS